MDWWIYIVLIGGFLLHKHGETTKADKFFKKV